MHRIFRVKAYEKEHGPHFNEEYARKAVMKMENDVQAGDLQVNFRYLIYYNKCNNTYQLVNAYPANIATPGA